MNKGIVIVLCLFFCFRNLVFPQIGTLVGTGMSICNQYSFSICPSQTISPLDYGNQFYSCDGTSKPDVSFINMGTIWRVMKYNWTFTSTINGVLSGYDNSGAIHTFTFPASSTVTPLSYSGTFVEFAINGITIGELLDQTTFSISINSSILANNTYSYCANTPSNIAISVSESGIDGPWTYNWQPGNQSGNPIVVSPLATTIYTVTASNALCTNTLLVSVNIASPPVITNVFLEHASCGNSTGAATVITTPANITYSWSSGISSSDNFVDSLSVGSYTFMAINGGCSTKTVISITDTKTNNISVFTSVVTPDCELNNGIILIDSVHGGNLPYQYSLNYSLLSNNSSFEQLSTGTYTLLVVDSNLCERIQYIELPNNNSEHTLYIPNTFTPNEDKINDVWYIKSTCLDSFRCFIYNRWGEKIKELVNIDDYWDGTFRGIQVPDGIYIYIIEYNISNNNIQQSGHISLYR